MRAGGSIKDEKHEKLEEENGKKEKGMKTNNRQKEQREDLGHKLGGGTAKSWTRSQGAGILGPPLSSVSMDKSCPMF